MRIAVIINPVAGAGSPEMSARRARLAAAFFDSQRVEHEILVTEHGGHARELAAGAVTRGATIVCAWGGDGTVNEIASALISTSAALAIVPAGSGNGLARELGIPKQPAAALAIAIGGLERSIDAGELGGRLFVNVAGIGFDGAVARRFADLRAGRRGFLRYLVIASREFWRYRPETYTIDTAASRSATRAFMVVLANARQYGNGAVIAPQARLDDGRLDLIVVQTTARFGILRRVPRVFRGTLAAEQGIVGMERVDEVEIQATGQPWMHVDGEPVLVTGRIRGRVLPGVIRVRVPRASPHDSEAPSTNR